MSKQGDLKVWWKPQIPGESFKVPVATPAEAKTLLGVLADYDIWQYNHRIKPNFCNTGGLMEWFDGTDGEHEAGWYDWTDDNGENIDDTSTLDAIKEKS